LAFVSKGDKKEATVRDAQNYCLGLKCRHQLLADAFGEEIPPCQVSCDFCVNPKGVQEAMEAAASHKTETVDNWRSSRKKLLKKIGKAGRLSQGGSSQSQDSLEGSRSDSPKKKVLRFNVKNKTMTYIEDNGKKFLICLTFGF
jgi:superfamily II DNA helicase RecQ